MSSRGTHWCHTCNRAIQPNLSHMICPHCYGGFIQNLNDIDGGGRTANNVHRNHAMHDVRGIDNMFHNHGMGGMGMDIHGNHGMHVGGGSTHNMFHNHGTWGMGMDFHENNHGMYGNGGMHSHGMGGLGMDFHGNHGMHDHGMGMQFPAHGRGHFLRDEVDDAGMMMMNHGFDFMGNNGELDRPVEPVRRGGSGEADSLQTVTITQRNVDDESSCPICMENFELNSQVKETPCKHLYHENCIGPWLQQHSTCPVCRQDLSSHSARGSNGETTNGSHNISGDATNGSTNRRGGGTNGSNNRGGGATNGSNNGTVDSIVDDDGQPNPLPLIFTTGISLVVLLIANLHPLSLSAP